MNSLIYKINFAAHWKIQTSILLISFDHQYSKSLCGSKYRWIKDIKNRQHNTQPHMY